MCARIPDSLFLSGVRFARKEEVIYFFIFKKRCTKKYVKAIIPRKIGLDAGRKIIDEDEKVESRGDF